MSSHAQDVAARAVGLSKTYGTGDTQVHALSSVSADFARGEFTAIMGPSGSGKSTLMHCLAGLDSASSGSVLIGETELTTLSDKQMTQLRRDRIGFVFQAFNLVPTLTALENITLPLDIAGRKADPTWLNSVLTKLGLGDRLDHRPGELSGGQQQRVACARALAGQPEIIFGDEPTGNLDSKSSGEVLDPAGGRRRVQPDRGDRDARSAGSGVCRPGGVPRGRQDRRRIARAYGGFGPRPDEASGRSAGGRERGSRGLSTWLR